MKKISAASCFNLDIRNQCRCLQGDEETRLIKRSSYRIPIPIFADLHP